jgi:hypothetical protein
VPFVVFLPAAQRVVRAFRFFLLALPGFFYGLVVFVWGVVLGISWLVGFLEQSLVFLFSGTSWVVFVFASLLGRLFSGFLGLAGLLSGAVPLARRSLVRLAAAAGPAAGPAAGFFGRAYRLVRLADAVGFAGMARLVGFLYARVGFFDCFYVRVVGLVGRRGHRVASSANATARFVWGRVCGWGASFNRLVSQIPPRISGTLPFLASEASLLWRVLRALAEIRGLRRIVAWWGASLGSLGWSAGFWRGWPRNPAGFFNKKPGWWRQRRGPSGDPNSLPGQVGLYAFVGFLHIAVLVLAAYTVFLVCLPLVLLISYPVLSLCKALCFVGWLVFTAARDLFFEFIVDPLLDLRSFSPWEFLRERRALHGLNVWHDFFEPRLLYETGGGARSVLTRQFVTNEFFAYHVVPYSIVGPLLWAALFDAGTDRPDWLWERGPYTRNRPFPHTIWEVAFGLDLLFLASFVLWGGTFHAITRVQATYAPRQLPLVGLPVHRYSIRSYLFRV